MTKHEKGKNLYARVCKRWGSSEGNRGKNGWIDYRARKILGWDKLRLNIIQKKSKIMRFRDGG